MKISYAITVKDELNEIQRLVSLLLNNKRAQDEIVILLDETNGSKQVEEYLKAHSANSEFLWIAKPFYNHFADWKNTLTSLCNGNFIFQIDADEYPNEQLIASLPEILESNPDVDLYWIPRINTVEGITPEHIKQWRWVVDEKGWVNFPDYQSRLYRRTQSITLVNKVHEQISGAQIFAHLPMKEDFCLYHPKTIEKQEKQNNYYSIL